ncbi:hypothetical protein KW502_00565 [Mesonia sp. JHPTF-M18]|uniref:DUF2460 domain-containing protein n=2 Tax=Mesonia aestuariivivens TaxID=2796128 RepID=A0ABS6VXN2_9FLAO|nr:hypothetical protein [Mesonia aestuariivivens]
MRITRFLFFFFCFAGVMQAQEINTDFQSKRVSVRDTIAVDTVSINSFYFKLKDKQNKEIDTSLYEIDFATAKLVLNDSLLTATDSLVVEYKSYPEFLTKRYYQFDPKVIVEGGLNERIYKMGQPDQPRTFTPFEGLNTSGSISRGITTGTNQNTVLDSELDLQITGKIAPNVSLRASIQDSNIPIQQSGYSQNLDEFDQIFIELYGKNWNVRAGDVDLVQADSYFASFTKKVQGLSVGAKLNPEGNRTDVYAAGALVRGVFTRNQFQGQEGNQGPYKLSGPNGELYVLIVSGSERVFVNGTQLQRGENEDYIIDYNAGEIIFNPTFPITSEMRITVEFQYADRNFSRVVALGGGKHYSEKLEIGGFVYSENDLKNQPLQQNLSDEQKQVLADAGDNQEEMIAPSAIPDTFDENKVLYRQEIVNGEEIYVYSNNPEDELFNVRFSLVGVNQGNYILTNASAVSRIYEYVPPENGIPQGNYAPVTQLFAPTKLQIGVVNGMYTPSEKTSIGFELAGSKYDENLFSEFDNDDNDGFAGRLQAKQNIITSPINTLSAFGTLNFIQKNYQSVERLYNVEFTRDWNLPTLIKGDQSYLDTGLEFTSKNHGTARYSFQKLDYSENYNGARQLLQSNLKFGKLKLQASGSYLTSKGELFDSEFLRAYTNAIYDFGKVWAGSRISLEDNQQTDKQTEKLTGISQKFNSYEIYTGVGDSTNVYAEIGYRYRVNDSLRNGTLDRVNASNNYYLKSRLINSEKTKLAVFANYRTLKNKLEELPDEQSLNSRIQYNQFLFNRIVSLNTTYETNSGTLPQQEFTYVEVNSGEGQYTWIDYNDNGVQELEEFEIAAYSDEAKYIRVLLPNQIFLKTHQNKFSQIVTLNFQQWSDEEKTKKILSHFYNQTSYLIDKKIEREGDNFDLNPFNETDDELAVNLNFRNTIFFNRGKQHYTTSYSYISTRNKNLLSTGLQENTIQSHQLNFNHKFQESWLVNLQNKWNETRSDSENFNNRNYKINGLIFNPELSYLLSKNTRFSVFYEFAEQKNQIGDLEKLNQNKLGVSCTFNNAQKYAINGEFNYIYNEFEGSAFSPVAYQMLQGLQPDKNFTWSLLAQKKITDYLDLNLSYFGRKSENSTTIHTGSVQLRAYF